MNEITKDQSLELAQAVIEDAFQNWANIQYETFKDCLSNPWKYAEEHRRGITDVQWARMQPKEQGYYIGDVVEFKVGGIGVISEVNEAHNGWPVSYSTERVKGKEYRRDNKVAWHYEGDFARLVSPSGIRNVE